MPLVVPLLIIVPFGPLLAWKRGDLRAAAERLMLAFGLAIAGAIIAAVIAGAQSALALFGVWLGVWLIAGALSELAFRIKLRRRAAGESVRRAAGLPRSAFGTDARPCGRWRHGPRRRRRNDVGHGVDPFHEAERHRRRSPATS